MARKISLLTLLVVALIGCGMPFEYENSSDAPKGGGLFSGPEGAFTISSDKKKESKALTTKTASTASSSIPEDYREFQDYQEFQRWKASAKDSPEYRDFQDWREWRAHKVWKGQQSK